MDAFTENHPGKVGGKDLPNQSHLTHLPEKFQCPECQFEIRTYLGLVWHCYHDHLDIFELECPNKNRKCNEGITYYHTNINPNAPAAFKTPAKYKTPKRQRRTPGSANKDPRTPGSASKTPNKRARTRMEEEEFRLQARTDKLSMVTNGLPNDLRNVYEKRYRQALFGEGPSLAPSEGLDNNSNTNEQPDFQASPTPIENQPENANLPQLIKDYTEKVSKLKLQLAHCQQGAPYPSATQVTSDQQTESFESTKADRLEALKKAVKSATPECSISTELPVLVLEDIAEQLPDTPAKLKDILSEVFQETDPLMDKYGHLILAVCIEFINNHKVSKIKKKLSAKQEILNALLASDKYARLLKVKNKELEGKNEEIKRLECDLQKNCTEMLSWKEKCNKREAETLKMKNMTDNSAGSWWNPALAKSTLELAEANSRIAKMREKIKNYEKVILAQNKWYGTTQGNTQQN